MLKRHIITYSVSPSQDFKAAGLPVVMPLQEPSF